MVDDPQLVTQIDDELAHGLCRVVDRVSERHTENSSRWNGNLVVTTRRLKEDKMGRTTRKVSTTANSSN